MNNPWEKIDLDIYETHMSSENVFQLQTLSNITKQQLSEYTNTFVAILGIAGGNGLEHVDVLSTKKVFGLDVNRKYLEKCRERYHELGDVLELILCDLRNTHTCLPSQISSYAI